MQFIYPSIQVLRYNKNTFINLLGNILDKDLDYPVSFILPIGSPVYDLFYIEKIDFIHKIRTNKNFIISNGKTVNTVKEAQKELKPFISDNGPSSIYYIITNSKIIDNIIFKKDIILNELNEDLYILNYNIPRYLIKIFKNNYFIYNKEYFLESNLKFCIPYIFKEFLKEGEYIKKENKWNIYQNNKEIESIKNEIIKEYLDFLDTYESLYYNFFLAIHNNELLNNIEIGSNNINLVQVGNIQQINNLIKLLSNNKNKEINYIIKSLEQQLKVFLSK